MLKSLTAEQLAQLNTDLEALRLEVERLLDQGRSETAPVGLDRPIGRLSRMDALQQQSMARAGQAILQKRSRQITAALVLMEDGEYGDCRHCEEPIGFERLKARPESPYCFECQSRVEKRA